MTTDKNNKNRLQQVTESRKEITGNEIKVGIYSEIEYTTDWTS